ncbi:hypothetical protein [Pedobacter heparinus]|uniref:Uncharacterized protein n=1 Tax=Pedobacter heparinus (strain ATCC 13125 / DSM 2366 / CIP 104194 / JCM 7457 / NBRC 12017 / NCIMB 9290 / NRRL B-14731 / HIM 762-3) TaxID=485917 RepID=C6Y253_PEDHD|nr:hypothetical protein [Pedobacter heparinus]ACU03046.1 hypothetical protein Phep_0824 [Pedobacter heparinus DSM 2366]
MEGIVLLSVIYWIVVAVIFLIGIIKIIVASANNKPVKPALKLVIASVIMLVIGVGACAAILGGISVR